VNIIIVQTPLNIAKKIQHKGTKTQRHKENFLYRDNDEAGFKASSEIGSCLRQIGVKSLKVIRRDSLKDLPQKWDLADPLPPSKSPSFITDSLLRAESKAIGIERLETLASHHKMTLKQLNEVVCNVDDRLRPELEKKYGSKTWEIESCILAETSKKLQDKDRDRVISPVHSVEQVSQKDRGGKSVGREYD